ncbi:MAG TPA: S8 family peptidase [Pyrinomonadaceae bacterium]|nr:S8 family peptidase [Pyrinomonadaceae bacterium]
MPTKKSSAAPRRKSPRKRAARPASPKDVEPKPRPEAEPDRFSVGPEPAGSQSNLKESNPRRKPFNPETLDRTVIAIPLLRRLKAEDEYLKTHPDERPKVYPVVIDLNLTFSHGRDKAYEWADAAIRDLMKPGGGETVSDAKVAQYLFASLKGETIRELVRRDVRENSKSPGGGRGRPAIFHIWPDFEVRALTNKSVSTVKADAAHASFSAFGEGIVWAVLDSGIDFKHPHFKRHGNLITEGRLAPMDFTDEDRPFEDPFGHGTHVAGIIAGELGGPNAKRGEKKISAYLKGRDEEGNIAVEPAGINAISGMAPRCRLVNMRVLDSQGRGSTSNIIRALQEIQDINGYGRFPLIHGVNLSLGNDFEPEWFACGQSPLCVEVNRLVNSGVVVVVAAGNSGYGSLTLEDPETESRISGLSIGISLTINDPGNADLAITVGATHRNKPHIYGVSYFSSKGPTGDGRLKPDLLAPGEKIISCATGDALARFKSETGLDCNYVEDSGTSMAAPHVSGVIAAFLSVRPEFVGQPERVKQIFLSTATDLHRERYFQGHGLVDLMRAIQSV